MVWFSWFRAGGDGTRGRKSLRMGLFWREEDGHGREKRNNMFLIIFRRFLHFGKNGSGGRYGNQSNRHTTKLSFSGMKSQLISILKSQSAWSCAFWFSPCNPKGQFSDVLDFFCADGSWGWQSGRTYKWIAHLTIKTKFATRWSPKTVQYVDFYGK